MEPNRLLKFDALVKKYADAKTDANTKVRVGNRNGKIQLAIGSASGKAFGGSRSVKQLAHMVSQLGKKAEDRTSYEGKILKDFFIQHAGKELTKHLANEGVFKGKMTFGKLQTIYEALHRTGESPLGPTEPQEGIATLSVKGPSVKTGLKSENPKSLAQKRWIKHKTKGKNLAETSPLPGETSKSFLSGQRRVQHYNDLSEADKASLKTIIDQKSNQLDDDLQTFNAAKQAFKSTAQQKLEEHMQSLPDLMSFAQNTQSKGHIQSAHSKEALETLNNKAYDIHKLVSDLQSNNSYLRTAVEKDIDNWLYKIDNLYKAWVETDYINLDPKNLGFIDDFCKAATDSFAEYEKLALAANDQSKTLAEKRALEDAPMDKLLSDTGFSDATKAFLLNELARFSYSNPDLKGFNKYESFIKHLKQIEASSPESTQDLPPAKAVASSDNPLVSAISTLVKDADNRQALEQSLKAYAGQKNEALKRLALRLNMNSPIIVQRADKPNFQKAVAIIKEKLGDSLWDRDQSLSLSGIQTIDNSIDSFLKTPNEAVLNELLSSLKFNGEDKDLKTTLLEAIKKLKPDHNEPEAIAQKMLEEWYAYKKGQENIKGHIAATQIEGFLDYLVDKAKNF